MPRKGNNIRKRQDGRWEGRYISSYGVNGKAIYKSIYGSTYADVKREKSKAENSLTAEKANSSNKTIEGVIKDFLKKKKHTVKESSFSRYTCICENHIIPYFKNMKLHKLNNEIINDFMRYKIEKNKLSSKTVKDIVCLLVQIIKGHIHFKIDIEKPRDRQKDISVFTHEEYDRLKEFISTGMNNKKLGIMIVMLTGIRLGEICALKWENVNLEKGIISINRTIQRVKVTTPTEKSKTKIVIDTPKSEASIRTIPIPSILQAKLREFKSYDSSYILTNTSKYIEPRGYQKIFKSYLKSCCIQDNNFHTLRHTFATMSVAKGMDIKTLSILIGHTDVSFTMKRYVHPDMEYQKTQIEKLAIGF